MQAAFDKAVTGVLKQGCQALFNDGKSTSCAYRGLNGTACAVGQLLTDEQIVKYGVVENEVPSTFKEELIAELLPNVDGETAVLFLEQLQSAHDTALTSKFKLDFWERAMGVARQFNLRMPKS
jgi:hypothetical protein